MPQCPSPNQDRDEDSSGNDLYDDADAVRPHRISAGNAWPATALPPPLAHEVEFSVPNISKYQEGEKVRSESSVFGSFRCRILVFPMGTRAARGPPSLAAFVEADPLEEIEEDHRWLFASVKYSITLINYVDYSQSVVKTDTWSFSREGIDRGWHSFILSKEMLDPAKGWVKDDCILLRSQVCVRQGDSIACGVDYEPRKETGYLGLRNHGATCYLNGLLQSLYFQGKFREMVYSIDCLEDESTSLVKALQNVLYQLQTAPNGAVNCRELMKSFGWDNVDAFQQHDAQELNRILLDRLEEKLKGTKADGKIKGFFEGEFENYIQCTDVQYCSKRDETFYDLQLNVRAEDGRPLLTLLESFRDFCCEEILEGDNAYDAGPKFGKQRAKKGIRFKRFPPVLNLQLKRFTFDLETLDMVKLNNQLDFPTRLCLDEFCEGGGTYVLVAVVVHTGTVSSGHYYAFARPMSEDGKFGRWLKFDDESVMKCSEYRAVQNNYGGDDPVVFNYYTLSPEELHKREFHKGKFPTNPRIHSAYIITYVREDMQYELMRSPEPTPELVARFAKESKMKEKMRHDQATKVTIALMLEKDLLAFQPAGFWDAQEPPPGIVPYIEVSKDCFCSELWGIAHAALRRSFGLSESDDANRAPNDYPLAEQNIGLFVLRRRNNRQVRFSFLSPGSTIRSNLSMESPSTDSVLKMTILVVTSLGFNPMTLKWDPHTYHPDKGAVDQPPEDLSAWKDDSKCLVLLKYFEPSTETVTFLGSLYGRYEMETSSMNTFIEQRIRQGVAGVFGEGMRCLPSKDMSSTDWICWEEFSCTDIRPVRLQQTMKQADLYSGDILIWQANPGNIESPPSVRTVPSIPVACRTVCDLASKIANRVVVRGILHNIHDPLTIEGVCANGIWTEEADRNSPRVPQETIEMDLRWDLQDAFSLLSNKFEVPQDQMWAFRSNPSGTFEDPWAPYHQNSPVRSLKDLGWSPQKSPTVHLVAVPMCNWSTYARVYDPESLSDEMITCVRFFDDHVREVANCIVLVKKDATLSAAIEAAYASWTARPDPSTFSCRHLPVDGVVEGMPEAFRDVAIDDLRITHCYGENYCRSLEPLSPSSQLRMLPGIVKTNFLYNCIRVEPRLPKSGGVHILCYHSERQGSSFGHPFFLLVQQGDTVPLLRERIQKKLLVPHSEYRNWRICRVDSATDAYPVRNVLRDDETVDELWAFVSSPNSKFWLEHSHPSLRLSDSTPKPKAKPRGLVIR